MESGSDWDVYSQMVLGEGWMINAMMEVENDSWSLVVSCMGDGEGSMQVTFRP